MSSRGTLNEFGEIGIGVQAQTSAFTMAEPARPTNGRRGFLTAAFDAQTVALSRLGSQYLLGLEDIF